MFVVALFIVGKNWKQHKCPSSGEWMNKLQYINSVKYYSAMKRKKLFTQQHG